jgi:hypothetical protein
MLLSESIEKGYYVAAIYGTFVLLDVLMALASPIGIHKLLKGETAVAICQNGRFFISLR